MSRTPLFVVTVARLDLRGPTLQTLETKVLVRAATIELAASAVRETFPVPPIEAKPLMTFGPPTIVAVEAASFLLLDDDVRSDLPWQEPRRG